MKKLITLVLALALCLSIASCRNNDNNTDTGTAGNKNNDTVYDNNTNNGTGNTGGNTANNRVKMKKDIDAVARHLNLKDGTDTLYETIGAKAGKEYNNGKVELYHFDNDSAEYEAIKRGEGNIKAAAYEDGIVLVFTDKVDETMVREFQRIDFD